MVTELNIVDVIREARLAGHAAMQQALVQPMVVQDGNTRYVVPDGVCGFAWINVYGVRSNSKLGKAMVANGFRKDSYSKAMCYWVGEGNQSMGYKEAYAEAFAKTLQKYGMRAYANSRMD